MRWRWSTAGADVRPAAAFPPRRQLTTAGEHAAALRVIEAVDRQAFLAFPSLDRANTPPEIRGDFLPRVEPRLVRLACPDAWSCSAVRIAQQCAITRHCRIWRLVALEPRRYQVGHCGCESFRLAIGTPGGFHATHSKIVILFGALFVAVTAGVTVTPSAAGAACGVPGRVANRRGCRAGCTRSHVQARGDARHLPRPALQPGRSACRTAAPARWRTPSASADQLRAVWGPFVGEAGTFELSGNNMITMQATVAKNPAAMTKGAVERLHLPPRRRHVDADSGSHPRGSECESDHGQVDPRRVTRLHQRRSDMTSSRRA